MAKVHYLFFGFKTFYFFLVLLFKYNKRPAITKKEVKLFQ